MALVESKRLTVIDGSRASALCNFAAQFYVVVALAAQALALALALAVTLKMT